MQATLPERLEARNLIRQMQPGEQGFTQAWAMWVDLDMRCWLHPEYTIAARRAGTADLLIRRTRNGNYEVDTGATQHQWIPTANPGFMSSADTAYIPVSKVD